MPYPRSRINFGFRFYNPASPHIAAFRNKARAALTPLMNNGEVMFDTCIPVVVHIIFYLPRPQEDFVGRRRQPGNLKPSALTKTIIPVGADIDNLTKLVLDALTGVVFRDDRQVVKLVAYKVRDSYMSCNGSTVVEVSKFANNDVIPALELN